MTCGAAVVGVSVPADGDEEEEDSSFEVLLVDGEVDDEFDDAVVAPARLCSAKTPTSPSVLMVARTPAARVDLVIRRWPIFRAASGSNCRGGTE